MKKNQIEIFCGTGGVGKTTLSAAKAIQLASQGQKVLLITIDPSLRLKELIGLKEHQAGHITSVNFEDTSLDILLMSPKESFNRLLKKENIQPSSNRILSILMNKNGGMNEILSLVEINECLKKNIYNTIILDTPPGKHFLDFLHSTEKIQSFFDKSFIDIFNYLIKETQKSKIKVPFAGKLLKNIAQLGVGKLLKYLQTITGEAFISEFINAIQTFYQTKSYFLDSLELQKKMLHQENVKWYLVMGADQAKFEEAKSLFDHTQFFSQLSLIALINKCNEDRIKNDLNQANQDSKEFSILQTLYTREQTLKKTLHSEFNKCYYFDEQLTTSLNEQLKLLQMTWNQYEN